MRPARTTRPPEEIREGNSEAKNYATLNSPHGRSTVHASHGEDFPPAVECAPLGVDTCTAQAKARSGDATPPSQASSTPQRSKRGCHDDSDDEVISGSSSSSAPSTTNRRLKRARKTTLAAQRKQEERVDAAGYDTHQTHARQEEGETRARSVQNSTPSNRGGFGREITNRGVLGRARKCGPGDVNGDSPRCSEGKAAQVESGHDHPEGEKRRRKRSCGLDVCGVVCSAQGEPCGILSATTVHGENDRLCSACHRPSLEWAHFRPRSLSGIMQYLDDAKKRGVALPDGVLDGYRPSNGCLCKSKDCFWYSVRGQGKIQSRVRDVWAACKGYCQPGSRKLRSHEVAEAIRFFTSGRGERRRARGVDCTRPWLTKMSFLCATCGRSFRKDKRRRDNTPTCRGFGENVRDLHE